MRLGFGDSFRASGSGQACRVRQSPAMGLRWPMGIGRPALLGLFATAAVACGAHQPRATYSAAAVDDAFHKAGIRNTTTLGPRASAKATSNKHLTAIVYGHGVTALVFATTDYVQGLMPKEGFARCGRLAGARDGNVILETQARTNDPWLTAILKSLRKSGGRSDPNKNQNGSCPPRSP